MSQWLPGCFRKLQLVAPDITDETICGEEVVSFDGANVLPKHRFRRDRGSIPQPFKVRSPTHAYVVLRKSL